MEEMRGKLLIENVEDIYYAGAYIMKNRKTDEVKYVGTALAINEAINDRHYFYMKNGQYSDTNKKELQDLYDNDNLSFEVIYKGFDNATVRKMSEEEKIQLNEYLSVIEQFYIERYEDTICNMQKVVRRRSSNRDDSSTIKRRNSNKGVNNPRCKYDERIISEILWLKMNGYKAKEIEEIYKDAGIRGSYIYMIGIQKWIHAIPIKPSFIA